MSDSQKKRILDHLKMGHRITPLDALERFGCFRLSAVIFDLKVEGHEIEMKMVKNMNGKKYAEYKLQSWGGQFNF